MAALSIFANQLCFVYAVKTSTASVVALVLGATPIFAALLGLVLGTERLSRSFWLGAAVSFAGVGLVAAGSEGSSPAISAASCSRSRPRRPGPSTRSRSRR